MQASVKDCLIDIFSVNGNHTQEEWYQASDNQLTRALSDIGMEIFKSIHSKEPLNNEVGTFGFIEKIKTLNNEITIKKPEGKFDYFKSKWIVKGIIIDDYSKEMAKNPLSLDDQKKIIAIRKFLHFFSDSSHLMRSDQIAKKLNLSNYLIFHDYYIKYALKVSLSRKTDEGLYGEYSDCIDPFFWVFIGEYETMHHTTGSWFDSHMPTCKKHPLSHAIKVFDTEANNLNFIEKVYSKAHTSNHFTQAIIAPIYQLISSTIQIQKYIRRGHQVEKYVANHSCRTLQAYIKTFNERSRYLKKLRREKIFRTHPSIKIPILPHDIWLKITSLSVESIKDLLLVNTLFKSLVLTIIDDTKKSIETGCNNEFIKEIQALDTSIDFYSRKYDELKILFNKKKKKKYLLNVAKIPLNFENREKIKAIRCFMAAIKQDGQYSDEVAGKLHLKNYGFFHDQYVSYGLKIFSYFGILENFKYCRHYLECLDHNFYIHITWDLLNGLGPTYRCHLKRKLFEDALSRYRVNMNNVTRTESINYLSDNNAIRVNLGNFLLYLENHNNVPSSIISYFKNPTWLKKKLIWENHSPQILIKAQSLIRRFNNQNTLSDLKAKRIAKKIETRNALHTEVQVLSDTLTKEIDDANLNLEKLKLSLASEKNFNANLDELSHKRRIRAFHNQMKSVVFLSLIAALILIYQLTMTIDQNFENNILIRNIYN